jgi:hypothetical protein
MWSKTIIVDKSIIYPNRRFSYGFGGYEDDKPTWFKRAENVKLYDNVADAVADAKKLMEVLPVEVLTFNISVENQSVEVVTIKF